jgi:hypothetical protein
MLGGIWWSEGLALAVTFVDVGCVRTHSNGGAESSKVFTTPETEVLGCYAGTSLPSIFRLLCAENHMPSAHSLFSPASYSTKRGPLYF